MYGMFVLLRKPKIMADGKSEIYKAAVRPMTLHRKAIFYWSFKFDDADDIL